MLIQTFFFSHLILESSKIMITGLGNVYFTSNHLTNLSLLQFDYNITPYINNNIFDNTNPISLQSNFSQITFNTFVNKTASAAINIAATSGGQINGNIFQNYPNVFPSGTGSITFSYNCFYNNTTSPSNPDTTNIFKDPMLNSDFSLKPGSPCIGAYDYSDIGAITYVAPVCSFNFTYVNNYGANYTFTPQITNCNKFSTLTWTVRDISNIIIKTSTDSVLTYTMPEIGEYTVTLEGIDCKQPNAYF